MKVLLTQTIDKIGIVGEVLEVSEGYARNYLLPKKLAVTPTEGNIKRLEVAKLDYEKKLRDLRAQKEALLAKLTGFEVSLTRQANDEGHLFGSVSRRDIAEELIKAGFNITPEDVKLDEPIRRVDTFQITVGLAADLKTEIKLWVNREKPAAGEKSAGEAKPEGEPAAETPDEEIPDEDEASPA